jgi:hypothetical protein
VLDGDIAEGSMLTVDKDPEKEELCIKKEE